MSNYARLRAQTREVSMDVCETAAMANRVKQVTVPAADRVELERRVRSQTAPARDAKRARLVPLASSPPTDRGWVTHSSG